MVDTRSKIAVPKKVAQVSTPKKGKAASSSSSVSSASPPKPATATKKKPTRPLAPTVSLVSSDNITFTVPRPVAYESPYLEDELVNNDDDQVVLPNTESSVLERVIQYLTIRANETGETQEAAITEFQQEIIDSDMLTETLELLFAFASLRLTDYLGDINHAIESMIRGKTVKDLKHDYKLKFTPEDEAKARKELAKFNGQDEDAMETDEDETEEKEKEDEDEGEDEDEYKE